MVLQDLNYLKNKFSMDDLKYRCKLLVDHRLKDYKYSKLTYNPLFTFDPTVEGLCDTIQNQLCWVSARVDVVLL